MSRRREIGHRRVPAEFISKFKSVEKRESAEIQMVTNLIRVRNQTEKIRGWPRLTKW
jgi:hypothetical protein